MKLSNTLCNMLGIALVITVILMGCITPFTKEDPTYNVSSDLFEIYEDIIDGGKRLKREVTGRQGYSYEKWLIKDKDGNLHVVIVENGTLEAIDPITTEEDFDKYQPFGGWRKK